VIEGGEDPFRNLRRVTLAENAARQCRYDTSHLAGGNGHASVVPRLVPLIHPLFRVTRSVLGLRMSHLGGPSGCQLAIHRRTGNPAHVKTSRLVVRNATVLTGPKMERRDVPLHIADGAITSIGGPMSGEAEIIDASDLTLIPGFIDAHVHIGFYDPLEVLLGGVTTVRDLAWPPDEIFELSKRSRSADFDGPEILAAGPMLTAPGGYPTTAGWAPPGTGRVIADINDAEVAVSEVAEAGGCIVKIALNPPVGPTLDTPTLSAIVESAHARGLKVTGHVFGLDQLTKCLRAGVDELAHALMSEEQIPGSTIEEMVAARMVVVPTFACRFGSDLESAIDNVSRFLAAGGTVIYGTDLGDEGPVPGIDANEITSMARAGMSGFDILRSATHVSAGWLGLDDRGVIEPRKRADVIGVRGDPLDDPAALTSVELVIRQGRVVKVP
jgi:imidazolonepropionase-like amidohydrolase